MRFKYSARNKEGELQAGFVEAPTKESAIGILTGHELFILTMEGEEKKSFLSGLPFLREKVSLRDLMIFTRQFATLLSAQVPLDKTFSTLFEQTRNPLLKRTIEEVRQDIDSGLALSQALEKYENVFSSFYVNMVRSAEITGRLEEAASYLADYYERQTALSGKIKNSMTYPMVTVFLFLGVAGYLIIGVLPQIEEMFVSSGIKLSGFTHSLVVLGKFFVNWWFLVLFAIAALVVFFMDYFRSAEGKIVYDEMVFRMPVFGKLFRYIAISQFGESANILIKGGIPIAQALEITGDTIGNMIYSEALRSSAEDIRRGELLSQSLAKNPDLFPPLVSQMVAVGETTGRLDELLSKLSSFYSREVDETVGNLVELIQPALMIVIGGLVGGLFASILLPMFQFVSTL
jgi:type IV pilus assembly protein PilC